MAVAIAGSPTRARAFLKSAERQQARREMLRAIDSLAHADEADVLASAKALVVAVKAPAHPAAIVQALDAVSSAERAIARNVTPQLALEVMLFDIRKALSCPS